MSPTTIPSVHERLFGSVASLNGLGESSSPPPPQLSPVFKSEAAKQIIKEMTEKKVDTTPRRRQVPKEKRRHYTVSSSKPIFDLEDTITKMVVGILVSLFHFLIFFNGFSSFFFLNIKNSCLLCFETD